MESEKHLLVVVAEIKKSLSKEDGEKKGKTLLYRAAVCPQLSGSDNREIF